MSVSNNGWSNKRGTSDRVCKCGSWANHWVKFNAAKQTNLNKHRAAQHTTELSDAESWTICSEDGEERSGGGCGAGDGPFIKYKYPEHTDVSEMEKCRDSPGHQQNARGTNCAWSCLFWIRNIF